MDRPADLHFTHLNYTTHLLILLKRLCFLGHLLCAQLRFGKICQMFIRETIALGEEEAHFSVFG